jgi:hypothetical protein
MALFHIKDIISESAMFNIAPHRDGTVQEHKNSKPMVLLYSNQMPYHLMGPCTRGWLHCICMPINGI